MLSLLQKAAYQGFPQAYGIATLAAITDVDEDAMRLQQKTEVLVENRSNTSIRSSKKLYLSSDRARTELTLHR